MTREAQLVLGNVGFHTWEAGTSWDKIVHDAFFPVDPQDCQQPLLVNPLQSPALRHIEEGWDHSSSVHTDLGLYRQAMLWKDTMVKLDRQSESGYLCRRYDFLMVTEFKVCVPETDSLFQSLK